MAETSIEWTDFTVNFWWGCTKVGPGCDHCYAETWDKRTGGAHWGPHAERRWITVNDALARAALAKQIWNGVRIYMTVGKTVELPAIAKDTEGGAP